MRSAMVSSGANERARKRSATFVAFWVLEGRMLRLEGRLDQAALRVAIESAKRWHLEQDAGARPPFSEPFAMLVNDRLQPGAEPAGAETDSPVRVRKRIAFAAKQAKNQFESHELGPQRDGSPVAS